MSLVFAKGEIPVRQFLNGLEGWTLEKFSRQRKTGLIIFRDSPPLVRFFLVANQKMKEEVSRIRPHEAIFLPKEIATFAGVNLGECPLAEIFDGWCARIVQKRPARKNDHNAR